jgi:serine/threonine-protein kinase
MHDDKLLYEGLRPGVLFAARYELRRVLGQGGFGRVFLAHDQALDTSIALKVLSPALAEDEGHLKRFRREVLIARKISHRNVCKLFDIGQVGGLLYLTMEYVVHVAKI